MEAKDTFFCTTVSLNIRGRNVEFTEPLIMGIVNLTPDSFYSGSRARSEEEVLARCEKHINEGAAILDLGGCSTRPGSEQPEEQEELDRVFPLFSVVRKAFPDVLISIDTYRSKVARKAVDEGAAIINDVSGWAVDPEIVKVAANSGVPYVLSHIKGDFRNMQKNPVYHDILSEITEYFSARITKLKQAGVSEIILDPGFGFGKSFSDNYHLLNNLDHFTKLGYPVMAGISRKGMIQKAIGADAASAGDGTTVANTVALMKGASIIRVHDCKPAMDAVRILRNLN